MVKDWKVSVTVSNEGSICKCTVADLLMVVNFVELTIISEPHICRVLVQLQGNDGIILGQSHLNENKGIISWQNIWAHQWPYCLMCINCDMNIVLVSLHVIECAASHIHLLELPMIQYRYWKLVHKHQNKSQHLHHPAGNSVLMDWCYSPKWPTCHTLLHVNQWILGLHQERSQAT